MPKEIVYYQDESTSPKKVKNKKKFVENDQTILFRYSHKVNEENDKSPLLPIENTKSAKRLKITLSSGHFQPVEEKTEDLEKKRYKFFF